MFLVLRPTLAEFVLKMPRGAQVIYPKDLGPLLLLADIFPGCRVLESGVGSGALSMTMLRAGADVVGYEVRDDFASRAVKNVVAFLGPEVLDRYRVEERDTYEGIDETELDRVVLDLPEPWQVTPHAAEALRPGGILVAYTPTIMQAVQFRESLEPHGVRPGRDPRGAQPQLAHRRPVGATRPPHGRPHRLPQPRPPHRLTRLHRSRRRPARAPRPPGPVSGQNAAP